MTNLVDLLNAQLDAARKDLEKANAELAELIEKHKRERNAFKASIGILEGIVKDVERKIEKILVK